jgi:hypothetical protein
VFIAVRRLLTAKSRGPAKQVRAALAFSKGHAYNPTGEYNSKNLEVIA